MSDPYLPQFPRIVNTPRIQPYQCSSATAGEVSTVSCWEVSWHLGPTSSTTAGLEEVGGNSISKGKWSHILFKWVQCHRCVWLNSSLYLIGWISKAGCIFSPLRQYTVVFLLIKWQKENISSFHSLTFKNVWMTNRWRDGWCILPSLHRITSLIYGFWLELGWPSWVNQERWQGEPCQHVLPFL